MVGNWIEPLSRRPYRSNIPIIRQSPQKKLQIVVYLETAIISEVVKQN
jgi:hypothetical protein